MMMNKEINQIVKDFYFNEKAILAEKYEIKINPNQETLINHQLLLSNEQLLILGLSTNNAVFLEFGATEEYTQLRQDYYATGNKYLEEKLASFNRNVHYNYTYNHIKAIKIRL